MSAAQRENEWEPVRYEADSLGRMYVEYRNGTIHPARTIMSRFAGRSDVTPQEFDRERAEASPPDSKEGT